MLSDDYRQSPNFINPEDPHGIIPRGATIAAVKSFDFQIRTMVDYDANFMRDRVRCDVFANGKPVGVYAAVAVDDRQFEASRTGLRDAMQAYGPQLERSVIDEFMGLGYRRRVQELEDQVRELQAYIHRIRWWQLRRKWQARKARSEWPFGEEV